MEEFAWVEAETAIEGNLCTFLLNLAMNLKIL